MSADGITKRQFPGALTGIVLGIVYGLITRLIFGARVTDSFLSTLSIGFLIGVPFAVGAIVVYFLPKAQRDAGRVWSITLLSGVLFLIVVMLINLEVAICLCMAGPLFLAAVLIGGLVTNWILRQAEKRHVGRGPVNSLVTLLLLMPYLFTPVETRFEPQTSIRTVNTSIVINASAEAIWENITRVPTIRDEEQSFSWSQVLGIPQPDEATLSFDGVGGVRHASYRSGLSFIETVTVWEPLNTFAFSIKLDNPGDPSNPFSQIGGKYFDMIDATYTLERLDDGQIRLHLASRHRLTTNFNGYGGLWTDFILRDLQDYLLRIIKARAEQSSP